jgi:hypothetical protein
MLSELSDPPAAPSAEGNGSFMDEIENHFQLILLKPPSLRSSPKFKEMHWLALNVTLSAC